MRDFFISTTRFVKIGRIQGCRTISGIDYSLTGYLGKGFRRDFAFYQQTALDGDQIIVISPSQPRVTVNVFYIVIDRGNCFKTVKDVADNGFHHGRHRTATVQFIGKVNTLIVTFLVGHPPETHDIVFTVKGFLPDTG